MVKLVIFVLGFGAGYTIREIIKKTNKEQYVFPDESLKSYNETHTETEKPEDSFYLKTLDELLNRYHLNAHDTGCFIKLRSRIEFDGYFRLLSSLVNEGSTIEKLIKMIKEMKPFSYPISLDKTMQTGPAISQKQIDLWIEGEGISPGQLSSNEGKIEFLLTVSFGKGIKILTETYGRQFEELVTKYENGEEGEELYQSLTHQLKFEYRLASTNPNRY